MQREQSVFTLPLYFREIKLEAKLYIFITACRFKANKNYEDLENASPDP